MRRNKHTRKKQKVIQINVGFTILKVIAIIIIISLITAQTVRTIIQARTSTSEAETTEEEATYYLVDSTEIDEETGEYIQVPVPVGYTASQIEGETGVSTGFVIYEGDIDWSEIIVDGDTSIEGPTRPGEESSSSTSESGTQDTETTTSSLSETSSNSETNSDENTSDGETASENSDTNSNASETDEENSNTGSSASDDNEENSNTNSTSTVSKESSDDETNATSLEDETSETGTSESELSSNEGETESPDSEVEETEGETIDETEDISANEDIEETNKNIESSSSENEVLATSEEEIATASDGDYYLSEYYSEETASNIWDLQCSTNQYVWVPIDEEELENIYGVDSNGKYWGKLYSGYDTPLNWTETDGVMSITSNTSNREPDVTLSLTTYDTDEYLTSYLNQTTRYELLTELEENFYETIESIRKYGGFYIGRYETGNLSNSTAAVIKNNSDTGSKTWYVMYEKCKELAGENSNVTTSMIWGSLWDATLRWLYDSGATISDGTELTTTLIWSNSTTWANYYNATFDYYTAYNSTSTKSSSSATILRTGVSEYTKVNNIYDLAGNIWEITLESTSTTSRPGRGNSIYSNSYGYSASTRLTYNPESNYNNLGCRSTLFINYVS